VGRLAPAAPFSAAGLSSSVRVVQGAIRNVLARPQAHQASRLDDGLCIPPVPRPVAHREDAPASVHAPVARAAVLALVRVPAVLLVLAADFCLQAKHRVRSVRVARHAAVDASSTPRPRKAQ
jgi:hypothetical protein